ncbi:VWA domain-containing protein [Granulicella arctica]|uniref:VWA domain-containing protein n=1 Tax=Granulicella arctica TaxID=940613 RepID=UPI0021DFC51E|nr:VWA domain-containing protein [Granulicella arctica]
MEHFRPWLRKTLLIASLVQFSFAQAVTPAPEAAGSSPTYLLHQNVEEVLLYCTVLDHQGNLVTDLERSAFKVAEDKASVAITHFDHRDVPVSLALVLDGSGSMKEKRSAVQAAAVDLIKASNPDDETSVTNFADTSYLDQDFTSDLPRLQSALGQSKTVSGGTALFDTVISAANHLAEASHRNKEVIVVVTDGRDNASAADLSSAIRRVQTANGPVIYSIGLLYDLPGSDARRARHDLQALSDETGGIAFFPASVQEVDRIAAEVSKDIRNQYTIGYRPPSNTSSDGYRTIAVQAASSSHRDLVVRTRKGYLRTKASTSNN